MNRSYSLLVLALLCALGCAQKVPATQVMLRVYASDEVRTMSDALRLRVIAKGPSGWHEASSTQVPLETLRFPFDMPILPRSGGSLGATFEVIVETLANGKVMVESRVVTNFVPRGQKLLEISLTRCGTAPLGEVCAASSCIDPGSCLTCDRAEGACASVPIVPGDTLPDLTHDGAVHANPADPELDQRPGVDASTADARVATPSIHDGGSSDADAVLIPPSVDQGPCEADGGTPNLPFGAHRTSYVSSAILPSHLYRSERDAVVQEAYDRWKSAYLQRDECPGPARVYASANDDTSVKTTSDRHGYAMLIVALMAGHDRDEKALYDGLYQYYLDHASSDDSALMARTQVGCDDKYKGSASDGDLDIAYSLLLADKQWGSSGKIDYRKRASQMIAAIWQHDVNADGRYILLGAGVQSDSKHRDGTRTSDFMPGHLVSFAAAGEDGLWATLAASEYRLIEQLQRGYAESTGLLPDFAEGLSSQSPMPAMSNFFVGIDDGQYSQHACRVPLRIALHYLTSGDARAKQTVERINAWIDKSTNGDPLKVKAGYALDGSPLHPGWSMAFVAPLGVAAMASQRQDWLNALWDALADELRRDHLYLGDTLELLSLIAMSGNWWTPESVTCAPVPSLPFDAGVQDAGAEQDSGLPPPVMLCHNDQLMPQSAPPCGREPTQVPMMVSLGFSDRGDVEGMKWALDLAEQRGVNLTFFLQCAAAKANPAVLDVWHDAGAKGHELASYAMSTPSDGRTLEPSAWRSLIEDCQDFFVAQNLHPTGFRAPGLRYSDGMLSALENLGFQYDSSIREGFGEFEDGTNDVFPYTLGFDSPGHLAARARDPLLGALTPHPFLWELPVYDLLPPPALRRKLHSIQASYRTRLPPSDSTLWGKRERGGFEMSAEEVSATLKYSFERRMQGNHAPLLLDLATENYGGLPASSAPNASLANRRWAIEDFVDYVLARGARVVSHEKVRSFAYFPNGNE
jgi:endo-1,4-beta-D-glucanase Y